LDPVLAENGAMLELTQSGLYCPAGDFYVDPWAGVRRAVITHGHGDHARWGSRAYLAATLSRGILARRLPGAKVETLDYGEAQRVGDATVSFHPAGHILGSAQVRIEVGGRVAVVSGDYKTTSDPTCAGFEPVRCDLFVTESTFGLPIFRWPDEAVVATEINNWWRENAAVGRVSVLFAYALGKAQRLLACLDPGIGPILGHGAVEGMHDAYREAGVPLPPTTRLSDRGAVDRRSLVLAPPSAGGTAWMRRFGSVSTAFASGWMRVRGTRRRRAVDRGFVVSDHADWPGLLAAIEATGAAEVWVTHGYRESLARYLESTGRRTRVLSTRFDGESEAAEDLVEEPSAGDPAAVDPVDAGL
jgi:putative mRNA 3-end processing factor